VRLPDFICVGPGRTGTTWLNAALVGHVGLPLRVKETRFWGKYYHKGIQWYADHFNYCDRSRPIGEVCPYFATPGARERIADHLPDCRIIVTLRDPVDRSYSQYRTLRKMGLLRRGFEDELNHPRIAETNRYAFHLRGWKDLFGDDNVKVMLFDDLRRDPQAFLDEVCRFIGTPLIPLADQNIRPKDVNSDRYQPRSRRMSRRIGRLMDFLHEKRAYRTMNALDRVGFFDLCLKGRQVFPPLKPETELRLRRQFLPEIEALESITGLNLQAWREPSANINRWLELAVEHKQAAGSSRRRELAAILLALIPLATGAVPDGLDLGAMRFNARAVTSVLEADGDDEQGAMILALS